MLIRFPHYSDRLKRGLGSAITRHIAGSPELAEYHGLYTVRSTSNAQLSTLSAQAGSTSPDLTTAPGRRQSHTCELITLDLTSQRSIRDAAHTINARVAAGDIPPIRALVLNAGLQDFGKQQWLDDGLDVTFASNYLGHWLLVLLLLKSMDREHGRIVVVGSQAHECVTFSYSAFRSSRTVYVCFCFFRIVLDLFSPFLLMTMTKQNALLHGRTRLY